MVSLNPYEDFLTVSPVGRLEEALQAALSYLLFHKGEEFVTENVAYYREALGQDGEPREVSTCWLERVLLYFLDGFATPAWQR